MSFWAADWALRQRVEGPLLKLVLLLLAFNADDHDEVTVDLDVLERDTSASKDDLMDALVGLAAHVPPLLTLVEGVHGSPGVGMGVLLHVPDALPSRQQGREG